MAIVLAVLLSAAIVLGVVATRRAKQEARAARRALENEIADRSRSESQVARVEEDLQYNRIKEKVEVTPKEGLTGLILDAAPDAIVTIDADGVIINWNAQAEKLFGWPREDAIGARMVEKIIPPQYRDAHEHGMALYRKTGTGPLLNQRMELTALHRDGREFPVELSVSAVNSADGLICSAFVRDISERANPEEAATSLQARYRLFFEKNPLPCWLLDLTTLRFLEVNEAAVLHYGYSREEFLSMTVEDIRPPEELPRLRANMPRDPGGTIRTPGIWKHRKKDGSIIEVEIIAHPLPGPRPIEFVLAHDVTDRLRRETAVEESSERLNLALKASRTGVWTWDASADRVVWDAHAHVMFGRSPDRLTGSFADLLGAIHPEDREQLSALTKGGTTGQSDVNLEFRVIWPDRSLHCVTSRGQAVYDATGRISKIVAIAQDITQQRLVEEQLRQAQKMEAVGQLAAGISHDFNNILTVIIGHCSLLMESLKQEDPVYPRIEEITHAGERAASLTGQLLAFSRKQVLQPRIVNLAAVFEDMHRMLRRLIGENIEIATMIAGDLAQVRIDPGQLQQVIMNLVINARDAMPRGGRLTLELKNVDLDSSAARNHPDVIPGRYVMLAVSDNGEGMSPEIQARIFDPFFTTKEPGRGTGLGLAAVYGIVKQSGGYIWLYTEPEVGTTFKIFLPRVDEPAEAPPRQAPKAAGGNETILLVEDDAEVRSLTEEILRAAGYRVLVAEGPLEAFRASSRHPDTIHLLISDVVLKNLGGAEVADRIAALRPGIKVLFISGYTGDAIINHGMLDPSVAFLEKPFTPDGLCAKVRSVLDASAVLRRILVVDDEPAIRSLLASILTKAGYKVLTAGGGRDARAKAREYPIDLVLTDLAMPDEEGIELTRGLKAAHPHLRIIVMSGAFGSEVLDTARHLGADATLEKPVTAEALLTCISTLSTAPVTRS